jgi:hypothetical protein
MTLSNWDKTEEKKIVFYLNKLNLNKKNKIVIIYRCAVFVHRMSQLVVLGVLAEEEAVLTHVKVEALETPVSEANDRIFFTYVALGLVLCRLGCSQSMHYGKPHETLRFVLKPAEKVLRFNGRLQEFSVLIDTGTLKA